MKKTICFEYNIPIKGIKKKTICQFSDIHLTAWDELSPEDEKANAIKQTENWIHIRKSFAHEHNESFEQFQQIGTTAHYRNLIELANSVDAAVLCGDIMDYNSGANIREMEKGLNELKVPCVAVTGNHETPGNIPDGLTVSIIKNPIYSVDLGDMQIVGIDNSRRKITTEQLNQLKTLLETKKCTVIAMHVPIMTDGNREKLTEAGDYFQFNYSCCPAENLEFISMISDKKYNVAAVLTGHLHFHNVSEIANGIFQYGSSQGLLGNANLITIGE